MSATQSVVELVYFLCSLPSVVGSRLSFLQAVCSKLWKLVRKSRRAQTGGALDAMRLFEEVVDKAVESVAVGGMRGALSVILEDVGQSADGGMKFSGFDLSVSADFELLSQEAADPMQMCSTEIAWMSRTIGENNEKKPAFCQIGKERRETL